MARVSPWHSINPGTSDPVYHVCTTCHMGSWITSENRREGTGGHRICQWCEELIRRGEC